MARRSRSRAGASRSRRPRQPVSSTGSGRLRTTRPVVPETVLAALEGEAAYRVMTLDRRYWIDPFTGVAVKVADATDTAALAGYLAKYRSWEKGRPLDTALLRKTAWRVDLDRLLPVEPRLRLFLKNGSGWMNPYTGTIEEKVQKEGGRISPRTVDAMAGVLAQCREAADGGMLDRDELRERFRLEEKRYGDQQIETSDLERYRYEDLAQAHDVQVNMLADLPEVEGYDLAVHFAPHSGVSGDFYDFHRFDDGRLLIVLGDVTGHGVQAALVVSTMLKTLRFVRRETTDLRDILARLNDETREEMLAQQFTTVFTALLDPATGAVEVALAGHHPGLVANAAATTMLRRAGRPGMVIGIAGTGAFRQTLQVDRFTMQPGDILYQYTDGYFESVNDAGEEYGETRLAARLLQLGAKAQHPDEVVKAITDRVERYAGQVDDDLTMIAIGRRRDPD